MRNVTVKICASFLVPILIFTAPGLGCYEALAQVRMETGARPRALPGSVPAAGTFGFRGTLGVPSYALSGLLAPAYHAAIAPANNSGSPAASVEAVALAAQLPAAAVAGAAPVLSQSAARPPAEGQAPSLGELLFDPRSVALPTAEVAAMPVGTAKQAANSWFDRILGQGTRALSAEAVALPGAVFARPRPGLLGARARQGEAPDDVPLAALGQPTPQNTGGALAPAARSLFLTIAGAAGVIGLHKLAVLALPAVFGFVPAAALWAISSGILLFPVALHARYRLASKDSARLVGVKAFSDLLNGGFLGAVAAAGLSLASGIPLDAAYASLPAVMGATYAAASVTRGTGLGGALSLPLTWFSLNILPVLIGHAAAGPLTLAALAALVTLPAMTELAFFRKRIVRSAETGEPFALPRGLGAILDFPSYTWVMTGVVFALMTGYSPVWVNQAFLVWTLFGSHRAFNALFLGAAAWSAFTLLTGSAAPITFLVLAFAPERAAIGAKALLGKLLPRGKPAPSTEPEVRSEDSAPVRWPNLHFGLKLALLLVNLVGMGLLMSDAVLGIFSVSSYLINLGVAAALSALSVLMSMRLIRAVRKAQPADEASDPEFFRIIRNLLAKENAERRGKRPYPMPELVNDPDLGPNAYATGISPFKAMVGVTQGMKRITLDPDGAREALVRLMSSRLAADGELLDVYRMSIRRVLADLPEDAGPERIKLALRHADRGQIKAIGMNVLTGVLGHERTHVRKWHIVLGAITGAFSSAIAFSSYPVLWGVARAKGLWKKAMDGLRGAPAPSAPPAARNAGTERVEEAGPELIPPPVAVGPTIRLILWIARLSGALWAPILAQVLQMGASRLNESQADEGGALLTEHPEDLALGLGLLITWRPPESFKMDKARLPLIASQAHIMTVNPIEQLYRAGLLDEGLRGGAVASDRDLSDLFVTHPDTVQRMKTLYRMALASRSGRAPASLR